MGEENIEPKL